MALRFTAAIIAAIAVSTPVLADDATPSGVRASNDLLDLFSQVCMKNLGKPEGVKAWAAGHQLVSIQAPSAITTYVGAGDGGAVWPVPLPSGLFALAIRASTKTCAVYGDKADSHTVEAYIAHLVAAMGQSGRTIEILRDDRTQSEFGLRHGVVYSVGFTRMTMTLTVITNERSGGPYQATVQVLATPRVGS